MPINLAKPKPAPVAIKPAALGSISHGTLRPEDLLTAFISEMEWQQNRNGKYLSEPEHFQERDRLARIIGEAQDCFAEDGEDIDPEKEEEAQELINETIPDLLQSMFAPPYCYFGSHPGDGSDFGYWPDSEQIDELPNVENSDEAKELGEDCKYVNDHGNVTVYGGDGTTLIDFV